MDETTHLEAQAIANDRHRPRYHFLPPANWLNDPNGLIHWNGEYHMFYQYNPAGPFHGTIHWGHAASADLVHWRHLPVALAPTPDSPDQDGCWSGVAVDDGGVPTLIYSGHRNHQQRACLAISADGLLTWQKYAGNPVIAAPPADLDLEAFRDHCVWKEGDSWYQIIGAGIRGVGGTALLYSSLDLREWRYLHPICVGDLRQTEPLWTGTMWECPDLFPLGDRHVLAVSVWDAGQTHYSIAFVGSYAGQYFSPGPPCKLDDGASFYAPQSLRDAAGRRIMFGWLREERDDRAQRAAGWSGVMSLPRILSLGADGALDMQPVPELAQLRREHVSAADLDAAGAARALAGVRGDSLEIAAEILPGDAGEVGLVLLRSDEGAEQTSLSYDRAAGRLALDTRQSSLSETAHGGRHTAAMSLAPGEPLRLRIFVDRSIVEVFANERACVTGRVYPTRADSLGYDCFDRSGGATIRRLDAWRLDSIWPAE